MAERLRDSYEGDWVGDFGHENGNYINRCIKCGGNFWGHKRRIVCRLCASKPAPHSKGDG